MEAASFPQLLARDLDGHEAALPSDLPGELTVVLIAFERDHQRLVDSWVRWLEERAALDPRLRFVEIPTIGLRWVPARPAIDGGMRSAVRDAVARRRTLTVYTDVRRVTAALGISDRDTIWLGLVDHGGRVRWSGSGGFDRSTAASLEAALADTTDRTWAPGAEQFEMAFDARFRIALAGAGITPATAHVTLSQDRLVACFGPWDCHTTPANVREVSVTGPYRWYRAVGVRLSLADRGLTFGSSVTAGVCLQFRHPVHGLDPLGLLSHPNLTLTVAEPERFAAAVRRHAGLHDRP